MLILEKRRLLNLVNICPWIVDVVCVETLLVDVHELRDLLVQTHYFFERRHLEEVSDFVSFGIIERCVNVVFIWLFAVCCKLMLPILCRTNGVDPRVTWQEVGSHAD